MKAIEYLKSLVGSISRHKVLDDIARMRQELNESVLPSVSDIEKTLKGHELKSPEAKDLEKALSRLGPKFNGKGSTFAAIQLLFQQLNEKLDMLEDIVKESMGQDLEKEAITYRDTAVLQLLEVIHTVIDFTGDAALLILSREVVGTHEDHHGLVTKADEAKFKADLQNFVRCVKVVELSKAEMHKKIMDMPVASVQEHALDASDTLEMNLISPRFNLIYHYRMWSAENDIQRLKKMQEERRMVELMLQEYRNKQSGHADPVLEKQIELIADRRKKIAYQIAKITGDLD